MKKITDVLVVDDSVVIVKLLKKFLLNNGIHGYHFDEEHIHTASDGMEAFGMLSIEPNIKLIISDVNMPMLNGDEFLEILVDTGKIASLEVVFITNKETAAQLNSLTKRHILGVIHKPFNAESFPQSFNELLQAKQEERERCLLVTKENQEKKHIIGKVLNLYLESLALESDATQIIASINKNMSIEYPILEDEMISLMMIILEDYYEAKEFETQIEVKVLKKFYNRINNPDQDFTQINPFNLEKTFLFTLEHASSALDALEAPECEEVSKILFDDLKDKVSLLYADIKKFPQKNMALFEAYFEPMIEALKEHDDAVDSYHLQKLRAELTELVSFHRWMKQFYQEGTIFKKFPLLKSEAKLTETAKKSLQNIYNFLTNTILHYVGAIDHAVWKNAKASKEIKQYFRTKLPNKMLNTQNYLFHLKLIDKIKLKEYEQYEHEQVLVISNELATLQEIKNKQEAHFPLWHISGFSNPALLEVWLKNNEASKIVLDYDFKNPNYENGLEYLFYLAKNFSYIKKLFATESIYILASHAKLLEIQDKKGDLDFILISKPLREAEVRHTFLYS